MIFLEKLITLSSPNIDHEHICCALADKKGQCGVATKKQWLKDRFHEGLVFLKADVRGKVFIEYIPAERAWSPIDAPDYMFINCFWVSGRFQGKGYGKALLTRCIEDSKAKGKKGLVVISSNKKRPYLSDKKYLAGFGFRVCDEAPPYFQLLYLNFDEDTQAPKFKEKAKEGVIPNQKGLGIYYTAQCPFSVDYVTIALRTAQDLGVKVMAYQYENCQAAQNAPCAATTYSVFYDGVFITNEILTEKKVKELIDGNAK